MQLNIYFSFLFTVIVESSTTKGLVGCDMLEFMEAYIILGFLVWFYFNRLTPSKPQMNFHVVWLFLWLLCKIPYNALIILLNCKIRNETEKKRYFEQKKFWMTRFFLYFHYLLTFFPFLVHMEVLLPTFVLFFPQLSLDL